MSRTSKNKTASPVLTVGRAISPESAKASFRQLVKAPQNGSNNITDTFIRVMEHVQFLKPSGYTLSDVLYCAKPFELSRADIEPLWEIFIGHMEKLGKVSRLKISVYDDGPMIVPLSKF